MARRRGRRRAASRVADWLRALLAFLFSNVGVVGLVVAYTIAGAFMFQAIEGASEIERVNSMGRERYKTAQYLWHNVTLMYNPLNETAIKDRISKELRMYQNKIVFAVRRGWDGGRSSRQWSFSSAFLYSLTVITTIGYGHLSPRTPWGKITTIFYALLGMPLFLLYLTNVGELLARWCKCLYALICLCRGCPGFSRRRIVRLRNQLEISDAESIERPEHWRDYPNWDAVDYRSLDFQHPDYWSADYRNHYNRDHRNHNYHQGLGSRHPVYRHPEYWKPDYRIPEFRRQDVRKPDFRSSEYWNPDCRNPSRYPEFNYRYPETRYGTYPGRYPRLLPYRMSERRPLERIPERIPLQRIPWERFPEKYQESRRPPEWYRPPLRRPDYARSASMPQPYNPHERYFPRGWSEPVPRVEDQESSEFSYVTFDAQTITVPLSVCVFIMVGVFLLCVPPVNLHVYLYLSHFVQQLSENEGGSIEYNIPFCQEPYGYAALLYLIFGSMLFGMWEQWDQLDGAYFCFISLTSIGFGDFVPGERVYTPRIETSFIVCSMYLMLGMALVAMCFNLMQEQVIHYVAGFKRAVKRICRCRCKR